MMNEAELHKLAGERGFRLVPARKLKEPMAQLAAALRHNRIDAVIDVGANVGQYATALRELGWQGPIVSVEPGEAAHAALSAAAAADPDWLVAPRLALAATDGTALLQLSAESDMSSLLPQTERLRALSPTSRVVAETAVATARLDGLDVVVGRPWQRLFLKIDVQGTEPAVLAGAERLWPRIVGVQLELSLMRLYEGEKPWRVLLDEVCGRGFSPHLWIPGYFSRQLARQLQVDVVLFRDD